MTVPESLPEMPCRELVELITDYLAGTLPTRDRVRFEEHLATCRGCREYLSQIRKTVDLVGTLTEDHLEPQAKSELMSLFRDWKQSPG